MKAIRTTLIQALVLLNIGVVVALAMNAARSGTKGYIEPTRNYVPHVNGRTGNASTGTPTDNGAAHENANPEGPSNGATVKPAEDEGPYPTVSFEEVKRVYDDPTRIGFDVFIDARDDTPYNEGHIPGALQLWPYHPEFYIDNVLDMAMGAERVIIYCNGGDCEDSYMAAEILEQYGVMKPKLHIYKGGWEVWTANDMPIETSEE
jgi:rhodanese-related sulfurtransferase